MAPKKKQKAATVAPPVSSRIPRPDAELSEATKAARKAARTAEAHDTPPTWPEGTRYYHTPHYLGGGGCGQAHLWLAVDANDRITDRKVVKDAWINPPTWRDVNSWIGNPADPRNRTHREIYFHQKLHPQKSRQGGEYVSKMFYSECYPRSKMGYRLYLQYYPHGDLDDVAKMYNQFNVPIVQRLLDRARARARRRAAARTKATKAAKKAAKAKPQQQTQGRTGQDAQTVEQGAGEDDEEEEEQIRIIPEPFLWCVLECLTLACLLLARGSADPEVAEEDDWQQIVHRDIKLDNTYLDIPSNETYPSYPRAVLADLGMAIQTFDNDLRNPTDFVGEEGTDTWQAPEQIPTMHRTTYEPNPAGWVLGAHTNVWAIGGIIIALMNRSTSLVGTKVSDFLKGPSQAVIDENIRDRYSERLRTLVGRCTEYWPDERIGLRELLEEIREYTGADEEDGDGDGVDAIRDLTRLLRRNEHAEEDQDMTLLYHDSDYPYKRKLARLALRALAGEAADGDSPEGDGDRAEGDGDGASAASGEDEDGE